MQNTPLDEGRGELWHRRSHLTKHRAPHARFVWIMADNRQQQNMTTCNRWIKQYGHRGRQVFRFEWRNRKRLLRPSLSDRFVPVKMDDHSFSEKLYRLNPSQDDDFGLLCGDPVKKNPKYPPSETMQYDYLRTVLTKKSIYSIPKAQDEEAEDFNPFPDLSFFQVVDITVPQARPKGVATNANRPSESK